MLQVVVHEKGGKTHRVPFDKDQFAIGREEDNDLVLDRVNVSKHHLRLRRNQGQIEVMDLQSTNGTYVNGRRVTTPRAVRRQDRIYVGDYILMLDGDDEAISPRERAELMVAGADGRPQRRIVGVAPTVHEPGEPLDDTSVVTSAKRVAPAGLESTYLDRIANRILQTVLANVHRLDPLKAPEIEDADREEALKLVDGLLSDMQAQGELEANLNLDPLKARVVRELLELGPLGELMKDNEVREIHVVGGAPVRIVREGVKEGGNVELTDSRFSGDRAVLLAIQRMAREWGFLVEGSLILEGKVDDGFYLYALLPPSQAQHPVLCLRRTRTDANDLSALVQEGVLGADMRELICACLRGCRKILICASGGVNLDRFTNALVGEIPDGLRVACISDTGRLGASRKGWVQVRRMHDPADTLGLSDALGVLLRGGLDLLVSQRCRHEDAAAVMDALAGAAQGAVVSLWGIDSAHALWRLAGLSTVASGAIQALTVSLARSVDILVRLSVGVNGEAMQVVEIIEPRVREGNELSYLPVFRAVKGPEGATQFQPTGSVPSFLRELAERGIAVPLGMFKAVAAL